ncbi:MAG: hypothetical protein NVS2B12_13910 [Ktedonobacteraceae bacterium]
MSITIFGPISKKQLITLGPVRFWITVRGDKHSYKEYNSSSQNRIFNVVEHEKIPLAE